MGDLASLQGEYGFKLTGSMPIFNTGWIPRSQVGFPWKDMAAVGVMRFDGLGSVQVVIAVNHNGAMLPGALPGNFSTPLEATYTVNSINTGTITIPNQIRIQGQLIGPIVLYFTMVKRWEELLLLWTSPARNLNYPTAVPSIPFTSSGYGLDLITPIWTAPWGDSPPLMSPPPIGAVVTGVAKRM